jgi:hypothetical protein
MTCKRKRRGVPRFLQLHHRLLKSHAWHALTTLERSAYTELAQLYDGTNNGRLAMSARRLADLIPCGKNAASRALNNLEDAGFIGTVKLGRYTRKAEERTASEYRLTDLRCDVTGDLPTRAYNPNHRWEPGQPKPKRAKALTGAERMQRFRKRKRRDERDAERPSQRDGTVPPKGTDCVTHSNVKQRQSRKPAKNASSKRDDVTLSVPLAGTHIHLTRGYAGSEHHPTVLSTRSKVRGNGGKPSGKNNGGVFDASSVTSLKALAPGHSTCKYPTTTSLPAGWHWCRFERCVVTDTGVSVPIVDDPIVGTDAQREALRFLRRWESRCALTSIHETA